MSWRKDIAERHDLTDDEARALTGNTYAEMNAQAVGLAHSKFVLGVLNTPKSAQDPLLDALIGVDR